MNCDEIQGLLSAWIDGDVSAETASAIDAHLQSCAKCATEAAALKEVHERLAQLAPGDEAVDRVVGQVLANWTPLRVAQPAKSAPPTVSRVLRWQAMIAAALLIVVGIWIWQQAQDAGPGGVQRPPLAGIQEAGEEDAGSVINDNPIMPQLADGSVAGVAHVVHTRGTVEVKYLDREEWLLVSFTPFACPSDSAVRTLDDSLCQMETSSGSIVRLDEQATVHVRAEDEIELENGRVWCKASSDGTLQVTPSLAEMPVPDVVDSMSCLSIPVFSCPANCSMQAQVTDSYDMQVQAVEGLVDVISNPFGTQLSSGEAVQIVGGRVDREYEEDAVLAMRWMLPLLATDAAEAEAFAERALASIGAAKAVIVYEADLVALGEPGAVPLLEFLKSTEADDRIEARRTAARVLSQTAGESMTSDLIDLLGDGDPEVRVSIATALLRLTGETQGREPEEWRADLSRLQESLSAWQLWRNEQ